MNNNLSKKGFSLMEVIFYMVLVGILIGIAVPNLGKLKEKAELTVIKSDSHTIKQIVMAEEIGEFEKAYLSDIDATLNDIYIKGNKVSDLPTGGKLYKIPKDIIINSGTKLSGDFFTDEDGNIIYKDLVGSSKKDDKDKEIDKEIDKDDDITDIDYSPKSDFKKALSGEWAYIGTDKVVKIPHELGGKKLTNYDYMFKGTDVEKVISDNPNIVSMNSTFSNLKSNKLDLSEFNTENVTSMRWTFEQNKFTTLNLKGFNTRKLEYLTETFRDVEVDELDLSHFKTPKLLDLDQTFRGAKIKKVDVSTFDTSNVDLMKWCFYGSDIEHLDLSSWDIIPGAPSSQFINEASIGFGYAKNEAMANFLNKKAGNKEVFKVKE